MRRKVAGVFYARARVRIKRALIRRTYRDLTNSECSFYVNARLACVNRVLIPLFEALCILKKEVAASLYFLFFFFFIRVVTSLKIDTHAE